MARKNRSTFWTDANAKFTGSGNKWEGQELDDTLEDLKDNAAWEDEVYVMPTNNYDCSQRNLQQRTLLSNGTLTISNAEAGRYYTLIKKGLYTLTLPAGEYSASGSVTGTGITIITFMYDGSDYYFNFSQYSGT